MFSSIINYFATNAGQEGQNDRVNPTDPQTSGQGESPDLVIEQKGVESETMVSLTNDAIQSVITSDS